MSFRKCIIAAIAFVFLLGSSCAARAQENPRDVLRTLDFKSGTIPLGDKLATLTLTSNYRFLDNRDTQTFLTKVYSNPPGAGADALGLIIPADVDPFGPDGWVALITYEATGHVGDSDANSINYDELLKEMQDAVTKGNDARVKQGYEKIALLGWAQKPYYDASAKKLYWAKRLRFGDDPDETLNYEIRILGRTGVLDLNIVSGTNVLPIINKKVGSILDMVQFNSGNTYAEYNSSTDKAAGYALAGLIAGGVLAKAGFFKALLLVLAASWKLVAAGVIAVFAAASTFFKKLFGRRVRQSSTTPPASS